MQRSLKYLRALGFTVGIVERYVSFYGGQPGGYRQDLFGFADLIAIRREDIWFIQCTTETGMSSHWTKMRKAEKRSKGKDGNVKITSFRSELEAVLGSGITVYLWGWKKGAHEPIVRKFTLADFPPLELPF